MGTGRYGRAIRPLWPSAEAGLPQRTRTHVHRQPVHSPTCRSQNEQVLISQWVGGRLSQQTQAPGTLRPIPPFLDSIGDLEHLTAPLWASVSSLVNGIIIIHTSWGSKGPHDPRGIVSIS